MPSITEPSHAQLILALDTSSSLGSVAVARGSALLKARSFEADHGHSQSLLPAIDALFTELGLGIEAVDLFAVVHGPGSFTGLRVSLACLRGLAGERPCLGALATDAAAWAARGSEAGILALTDLFHGEVFGGVHDREGNLVGEHASGPLESVLETLRPRLSGPLVAVGSATRRHRAAIEGTLPLAAFLDLPEGLAPHLASLASVRAAPNTLVRAADLLPFYLRDPLTRGLLNSTPKAK